jgi:hypothetical protein
MEIWKYIRNVQKSSENCSDVIPVAPGNTWNYPSHVLPLLRAAQGREKKAGKGFYTWTHAHKPWSNLTI